MHIYGTLVVCVFLFVCCCLFVSFFINSELLIMIGSHVFRFYLRILLCSINWRSEGKFRLRFTGSWVFWHKLISMITRYACVCLFSHLSVCYLFVFLLVADTAVFLFTFCLHCCIHPDCIFLCLYIIMFLLYGFAYRLLLPLRLRSRVCYDVTLSAVRVSLTTQVCWHCWRACLKAWCVSPTRLSLPSPISVFDHILLRVCEYEIRVPCFCFASCF